MDWNDCDLHDWERDISSQSFNACHCIRCGCPGAIEEFIIEDGEEVITEVYWPAT